MVWHFSVGWERKIIIPHIKRKISTLLTMQACMRCTKPVAYCKVSDRRDGTRATAMPSVALSFFRQRTDLFLLQHATDATGYAIPRAAGYLSTPSVCCSSSNNMRGGGKKVFTRFPASAAAHLGADAPIFWAERVGRGGEVSARHFAVTEQTLHVMMRCPHGLTRRRFWYVVDFSCLTGGAKTETERQRVICNITEVCDGIRVNKYVRPPANKTR